MRGSSRRIHVHVCHYPQELSTAGKQHVLEALNVRTALCCCLLCHHRLLHATNLAITGAIKAECLPESWASENVQSKVSLPVHEPGQGRGESLHKVSARPFWC